MTCSPSDFLRAPYQGHEPEVSDEAQTETRSDTEVSSVLLFELGASLFGIPAQNVSRLLRGVRITVLPYVTTRYCIGFAVERGAPFPIINIEAAMGVFSQVTSGESTVLIIIEVEGVLTGVRSDSILGVQKLHLSPDGGRRIGRLSISDSTFNNRPVALVDPRELARAVSEGAL